MMQGEACSLSAPIKQKPGPTEQSWCAGVVGRLNHHLSRGWRGGHGSGALLPSQDVCSHGTIPHHFVLFK